MKITIRFEDSNRVFMEERGISLKSNTKDEDLRAALAKVVQAAEAHLGTHAFRVA